MPEVSIIQKNIKTWKIYKELNVASDLYYLTQSREINFLVITSLVNERRKIG